MEEIIRAKKSGSKIDEQKGQRMRQINNFLLGYFDWLILVVALIILAVGFFMIIKPRYNLVSKDIELVELEQKGEFNNLQLYLNNLQKLQADYKNVAIEDKRKMDIILPKKGEIEEFFSKMEAFILKSGYILSSLQLSVDETEVIVEQTDSKSKSKNETSDQETDVATQAKTEDLLQKIGKVNITMSIIGTDYNGLKNLLRTIENNLRLMDINNLSWSGSSVNLQLVTYYLIE